MSKSLTSSTLSVLVRRILLLFLVWANPVSGGEAIRVLHVDSYHNGFTWSEGIAEGIQSRLLVENIGIKTVYLDAWRDPSQVGVEQAVDKFGELIRELDPDVLITTDDEATRLISENPAESSRTRYVYAGVNWTAERYPFPEGKVTGIVEVPLIRSVVNLLSKYAAGGRIGYLSLDTLSARVDLEYHPKQIGRDFHRVFLVADLDQWKQRFIELQTEVDLLILNTPEGITGWDYADVREFVLREARIPLGSTYESLASISLICIARIPQEQGWWAADAAMQIIQGTSPSDIPASRNREGKLIVNLELAHRLNLTVNQEILEIAEILNYES